MTSETSSAVLQLPMHLQCVQGCSLFVRHHHHHLNHDHPAAHQHSLHKSFHSVHISNSNFSPAASGSPSHPESNNNTDATSSYQVCCSNSLKISDNHLSTKTHRSAPYILKSKVGDGEKMSFENGNEGIFPAQNGCCIITNPQGGGVPGGCDYIEEQCQNNNNQCGITSQDVNVSQCSTSGGLVPGGNSAMVMAMMVNSLNGNMSPGENDEDNEHDCDDDKVINGDTFGDAGELPDADSIKMFVGQIPKHMNESELKNLFEKYGRVYQINVLRDKATKQSKGCCFVTFFTRKAALDAQNALHNVKTLPGMNNTVQMKPADNENRYDRKLFIGMISKKLSETDVRTMFARFGTIDDCTVLRLPTGESRGCAFVTFSTKQSAQNAIKAVHQSITMEGCSSPIVVKFADTPRDKDQKRQSQLVTAPASLLSSLSSSTINPVQQQYYSALLHQQLQQQTHPASQTGFFSQLSPLGVQGLTGLGGLTAATAGAAGIPGLSSAHLGAATTNADLATLTGLLSGVTQSPHSLTVQNLHTLAALGGSSLSPTVSPLSSSDIYTGASGGSVGSGNSVASLASNGLQSGLATYHGLRTASAVNTKQVRAEGPEGCNLFIYHLPPECGDTELAQMFISFGTVLSAKVFIDKQTNLSKCFGFVSFDNQLSAQMAIQAMNGFQVGVKRLKVQLKRSKSKDAAKPY